MSGVQTRFLEGADNTFQIQRVQDCSQIVDYAKGMQAAGMGNGKDMKHAAEIPMVVVENYMTRNGLTFDEFCNSPEHVRAIVNDPALKAFRVWEGRV